MAGYKDRLPEQSARFYTHSSASLSGLVLALVCVRLCASVCVMLHINSINPQMAEAAALRFVDGLGLGLNELITGSQSLPR